MTNDDQAIAGLEAIARFIEVAERDTGQSRRVADFLLAWHNAEENGGWDVTDLLSVDDNIADGFAVHFVPSISTRTAWALKMKCSVCGNGGAQLPNGK